MPTSGVGAIPTFRKIPRLRYVPPGYSRGMDRKVSLSSPSRDEGKVGFLGQMMTPFRMKEARLGSRWS